MFQKNSMEGDLSKNYDTLYGITRQGNWTEEQNEFLYGGTYNNDKKKVYRSLEILNLSTSH